MTSNAPQVVEPHVVRDLAYSGMETIRPADDCCYGTTRKGTRCSRRRPPDWEVCPSHEEQSSGPGDLSCWTTRQELECEWYGLWPDSSAGKDPDAWLMRMQAGAMLGWSVYFLIRDNRIKVGTSRDVPARMRQLGHEEDDLLAVIPGGFAREREIHQRLRPWRIRGEWFSVCNDVLDILQDEVDRAILD